MSRNTTRALSTLRPRRTLAAALLASALSAAPYLACGAAAAELKPSPLVQIAEAKAASLTEEDRAELRRVEKYFNALQSIKARFVQITDSGKYSEGKLYFRRPDKIRFEYEPPVPVLVVVSDGWVNYFDSELKQTTKVPLSETPLSFLTRPQVAFSGDVTVTDVERKPGVFRIEVAETSAPDTGRIVLTFSREPLELRKWTIVDAQGTTVNVALFNAEHNSSLDDALFQFRDPNFGKRNR